MERMNELLTKCYTILGLRENASKREIAEAYGALKQACQGAETDNPETVSGQWEKLKELNWAYDTLLDFVRDEEEDGQSQGEGRGTEALEAGQAREKQSADSSGFVIGTGVGRARFIAKTIIWLLAALVFAAAGYFLRHSKAIGSRPQSAIPEQQNRKDSADILQYAKRAVITVAFEDKISGSAFLISPNGYIVTNAHVVRNRVGTAQFSSGEAEGVELVLMDPEKDFALLKVSGRSEYPYLRLGDSASCREGDSVIAIGSPFTLQSTFTKGIVSAKDRSLPDRAVSFIQTDAAVNPGNSGGPLINADGEVVGINTWVVNKGLAEGLNFAVAINDVKPLITKGQGLSEQERRSETSDVEAKWRKTVGQYQHRNDGQGLDSSREQWFKDYVRRIEELRRQNVERAEQERKRINEMIQQKREALGQCLKRAHDEYGYDWQDECSRAGRPNGCRLPQNEAIKVDRRYREDQEDCYRKYNET